MSSNCRTAPVRAATAALCAASVFIFLSPPASADETASATLDGASTEQLTLSTTAALPGPSLPNVPSVPTLPSVPSVPSVPSLPSVPSVPSLPDVPSVPSLPSLPTVPSVPSVPTVPSLPDAPSVPSLPSLPTVPSLPDAPTVPSLPDAPTVPSLPDAPTVPTVPSLPDAPTVPTVPSLPDAPTVPTVPSLPGAPGTGLIELPFYVPTDAENLPQDVGDLGYEVQTGVQVDPILVQATDTAIATAPVEDLPLLAPDGGCTSGWRYAPTGRATKTWRFSTKNNNKQYNYANEGTTATQSLSVTSARSGSWDVGASASVEVDAGVIVAGVKATFGVNVSRTSGWETSQTATMNIPPRRIGHMGYGVYGYATSGRYYYVNGQKCKTTIDKGVIKTWAPSFDSWRYWEERF
jgi:hypothetical protein